MKAYNWLQNQSDQVKELATTPDQLVSIFLKSTRLGQDSSARMELNDRPSLQNFKSELKNIAGMMGDLEKPAVATPPPAYHQPQQQQPQYQAPVQAAPSQALYDEMTQNLIREVKNELNLSSDSEAIRMLVKIGYQKVRSLYK